MLFSSPFGFSVLSKISLPLFLMQGLLLARSPQLPDAAGRRFGRSEKKGRGKKGLHLIFLGESTITGVGAKLQTLGLAGQVSKLLNETLKRPIEWETFGKKGATIEFLLKKILPSLRPKKKVDLFVISIGVNDGVQGTSPSLWKENIQRLNEELQKIFGPIPIVFCGIPPMENFPALMWPVSTLLGWRARLLNEILFSLQKKNVLVIPTPFPGKNCFALDGVHPNTTGYSKWAKEIAEKVTTWSYFQKKAFS